MQCWGKYVKSEEGEVVGVLRKTHSKKLHNLCSSLNTGVVQFRIAWSGHVYIREIRNTYKNLIRKPEVKKLC
jgi:hypothetical protein